MLLALLASLRPSSMARAQDLVFQDNFELGHGLLWSRRTTDQIIPLDEGASLRVLDGSLAVGTSLDVTTIPAPTMPAGVQPAGSFFVIEITPDPIYPVELRVPVSSRGPIGQALIFECSFDQNCEDHGVFATRFVQAGLLRGLVASSGTFGPVTGQHIPLSFDLEIDPNPAAIGETTESTLDWTGGPSHTVELATIEFGDGAVDAAVPSPPPTSQSFLHDYFDHGTYTVEASLVYDTPTATWISSARKAVLVAATHHGKWSYCFADNCIVKNGTLDFLTSHGVRGEYLPSQHGLITGTTSGRVLTGVWVETLSARDCQTEMLDSQGELTDTWGRIELTFNDTYTRFCGKWGYCNEGDPAGTGLDFTWNGWRENLDPVSCTP